MCLGGATISFKIGGISRLKSRIGFDRYATPCIDCECTFRHHGSLYI